MGFLRRAFAPRPRQEWPPLDGPITSWPGQLQLGANLRAVMLDAGRYVVEVVGEGSHQGTIEQAVGGRTIDGALEPDQIAILMPEPANPYDSNAVRVVFPNGGTVGYLSRENAVAYRPAIDRLAAVGKLVACRAAVRGGWDRGPGDRGNFGVKLHMGLPADVMAELEAEPETLIAPWDASKLND